MRKSKVISRWKLTITITAIFIALLIITSNGFAENFVLKYSHVGPPVSIHSLGMAYFEKRVEELSNGRIDVQIYPSGQLGGKIESMEGLRAGTIEMAEVAATDMSGFSKMWSVFSLPFLFSDEDHLFRVLHNPEISKILNEDAESVEFKILGWWTFGGRSMINSKRAIYNPEDMKGLKIRVMQDPFLAQVIKLMGGNPVPMPWVEVYTSLQQGAIDGLENSALLFADNKFYEVAKYFSLTEHFRIPDPQLISLKFFNSLPKDLQDVLIQAGKETEDEFRKLWANYEGEAVKVLKNNGVKTNEVDKAVFREAVAPIYEDFLSGASLETKKLYNLFREVK